MRPSLSMTPSQMPHSPNLSSQNQSNGGERLLAPFTNKVLGEPGTHSLGPSSAGKSRSLRTLPSSSEAATCSCSEEAAGPLDLAKICQPCRTAEWPASAAPGLVTVAPGSQNTPLHRPRPPDGRSGAAAPGQRWSPGPSGAWCHHHLGVDTP